MPASATEVDPLGAFLRPLLEDGQVALTPATAGEGPPSGPTLDLLAGYARCEALDLAGPPIPLDAEVAARAAEIVRQACWALYDRSEDESALAGRLRWEMRPATPSHHFSADLLFRFLPQVQRRARAIAPDDPLADLLADLLAAWPLSGVLASLDRGPASPPDLGDHPGLWLLYAERHDEREHPAWAPAERGLPYLELVKMSRSEPKRPRPAAGGRDA